MRLAEVIHWKTNHAAGVRCFSDLAYAQRRVERAGGSLDDLHAVGGMFVYWPPSMGAFPNAQTLEQWEVEFDARMLPEVLVRNGEALERRQLERMSPDEQLKALIRKVFPT